MKEKQLILIVEDEAINRNLLKKILSERYNIIEASNGKDGLEILLDKRDELSAILLDVFLPVMDGFEFLKKMQEKSIFDVPVLVTTSLSDNESEQKLLDAGAWDYTLKPYNPKILESRLRNAIARSKASAFEKLKYMSEHDELTDLYNRRKMFAVTSNMLKNNPEKRFVFVRLDIDHFSLFNTSFGEAEGDKLLRFTADCIRQCTNVRNLITYGRINADVFCACFEYTIDETCFDDIISFIQNKIASFRNDYFIEISVGICEVDDNNGNIDDYYLRSTIASAECKNKYETHLAYYDKSAGEKLAKELLISNEMQNALNEEQFVIYFQPKINLSTESICGAEALVRWNHPIKGLVSPAEFIPVFEKNGFISKLDYFVWERTCQILKSWLDNGYQVCPVSVNVSRISLYNPELVELISKLVEKYNIPKQLFQLEITESAYMTNPSLMEGTIEALHDAGFVILMDDFGSGYSSLNTLKRIKVDVLKVDIKFMPVKEETERAEIILACVIRMANWLGMEVICEGVETRRQRDFLEGAGCESVQGFYYSKPIPQIDFEKKYICVSKKTVACKSEESEEECVPKHNRTVLVIDASKVEREMLNKNLNGCFHVHLCESAEAGLAYLRQNSNKVRLVIVDNYMTGMSGMDFLKYCSEDPMLKSIPKIMLATSGNANDQINALRSGAYDYITKPFEVEIVLARVNHIMDITRQTSFYDSIEVEYQKKLKRDSMTGLLNKKAFNEISSNIIEKYPDDNEALFVIDIDNFKELNKNEGHPLGDKIIKSVADLLKGSLRRTDIVGRFGGDEFVVFMTQIHNCEIARRKASDIVKLISLECQKTFNIAVTISIGIAYYGRGDTIDTLFARADQALYEAKSTGKGKLVIYGDIAIDTPE